VVGGLAHPPLLAAAAGVGLLRLFPRFPTRRRAAGRRGDRGPAHPLWTRGARRRRDQWPAPDDRGRRPLVAALPAVAGAGTARHRGRDRAGVLRRRPLLRRAPEPGRSRRRAGQRAGVACALLWRQLLGPGEGWPRLTGRGPTPRPCAPARARSL